MEEIKIPKDNILPELRVGLEEKFKDMAAILGEYEVKEIEWTIDGLTVKIQTK